MNPLTLQATFSGLLHDIGKMVFRAGESTQDHSTSGYTWLSERLPDAQWRDILSGVRWHHARALRQAQLKCDSLAYILCVADNISAAADRREEESSSVRFDRTLLLHSIFSHLNGRHNGQALAPVCHDGHLHLPGEQPPVTSAQYASLLRVLQRGLEGITVSEQWTDSLLALLESCASNIPSSTYTGESPDISLFDHLKVTAAVGACISEYLLANSIRDFQAHLFENEIKFRDEKAFLLYTADLSGIQNLFIPLPHRARNGRCAAVLSF